MAVQEKLSDEKLTRMIARLDAVEYEQMQEGSAVRTADLLSLVSRNADRVLRGVSDADIANATLAQKAVATGIFLEKRQLLMGEPTQIIRTEERVQLNVLVAAVVQEAARRGLAIDATPEKPHVFVDALEDGQPTDTGEFGLAHTKLRARVEAGYDGARK